MSDDAASLLRAAGVRVFERGWLSSNNVLLASDPDDQTILVDTGYVTHASQTVALVQAALGGRGLDRIVNTHLHSDHCGGNAALRAVHACRIDVPRGEVAKVDAWDEDALTYRATGQKCARFERTGAIGPGDEVRHGALRFEVIAAPGHDPESVVLFEPSHQLLISADALWQNGFGVVFPELEGEPGFDAVEATLDRIASLPVRCVIPGHGAPFTDVDDAVARARKRLHGLRSDPRRHATHAMKVLIKFRLLDTQAESRAELAAWFAGLPYAHTVHEMHFSGVDFDAWTDGHLADLARSGAIRIDVAFIRNA